MLALLFQNLLPTGVGVGLTGALQRDLVVGELAAFWDRRSLGVRIGFRFRRRLRGLADIGWYVIDWSDHIWSSKG